jgi:LmbE family N-acetylglucosaminyl deacetylase
MDSKINKLMIVAHPDDETLFGGGELLNHKGEYKVVCLDYGNDMTRHREFLCAMEKLGVEKWEHWDGEEYKTPTSYDAKKLIPKLQRLIVERNWEKIVTHNKDGEYGHYRHKELHDLLRLLKPQKLWVFDSCEKNKLDTMTLSQKSHILRECYISQKRILRWFKWDCEKITKYEV